MHTTSTEFCIVKLDVSSGFIVTCCGQSMNAHPIHPSQTRLDLRLPADGQISIFISASWWQFDDPEVYAGPK